MTHNDDITRVWMELKQSTSSFPIFTAKKPSFIERMWNYFKEVWRG